jgi:hypothetical protein
LLPSGWHPDPRRRSKKTLEDVMAKLGETRLRQVLSMRPGWWASRTT